MPNQQLTQIIDRLIAKADRDARGEGIEVQFEDRLGDIQKARSMLPCRLSAWFCRGLLALPFAVATREHLGDSPTGRMEAF